MRRSNDAPSSIRGRDPEYRSPEPSPGSDAHRKPLSIALQESSFVTRQIFSVNGGTVTN